MSRAGTPYPKLEWKADGRPDEAPLPARYDSGEYGPARAGRRRSSSPSFEVT
jgi:hypothetical protein